jgi:chromate transporter
VVDLLGAALYNPVWASPVKTGGDFAVALTGFVLLTAWRAPPLVVVIIGALGGIILAYARLWAIIGALLNAAGDFRDER